MKRPGLRPLTAAAVALLCGLCAGCSDRALIHHPGLDGGQAEGGLDDGSTPRLGNFPEPAVTQCGALPEGVDPIPGLATAWAVGGNAPGTSPDGGPFPDDLVLLRFADYGLECDEAVPEILESCQSMWTFGVGLPLANLQPGVHQLATLSDLFTETYVASSVDGDCIGGGIGGGGPGPGAEPQGELEIFALTDDCVVGELRGLLDVGGDLDVDRNGGFVAMRCHSDCVPLPFNGCGGE